VSEEAGSLTEEIVYIINVAAGSSLVESMIRLKRREKFSKGGVLDPCRVEAGREGNDRALLDWGRNGMLGPAQRTSHRLRSAGSHILRLSKRQAVFARTDCGELSARGHSTLWVAHNLGIAEGTAKIHQTNIYEKLHIISHA
jgi:DNA-binding CsgD family transcriptional regulator